MVGLARGDGGAWLEVYYRDYGVGLVWIGVEYKILRRVCGILVGEGRGRRHIRLLDIVMMYLLISWASR